MSRPPLRSRAPRLCASVVVLIAVLLVSACAGIPSAGPVTKVNADDGLGESTVRYSPAPPPKGASPDQVVRGFLDAMLAFPASTRTASAFLTPEAAKGWSPTRRVTVYSQQRVSGPMAPVGADKDPDSADVSTTRVRLEFTEDARLDQQGRYTRRAEASAMTYTLQQTGGEWRISNPQVGAMVSRKFFTDYFRQFNLFYFDVAGRRLAPDPVYLVVGDQLATALMTGLARGPREADSGAFRTYSPSLATLRPSVPVSRDGTADVEFSDDLADLGGSARDHLSAQIVWTLRQVPDIDGVQVVGGNTPLTANGNEVQPVGSWGSFGPSLARGRATGVADGKVVQVDRGAVAPLSGAWGRDARGAEFVAVSEQGVAGVLPGRDTVRVTDPDGGGASTVTGSRFVGPQWDVDGQLWLVDRPGATRLRLVADGRARTIEAGRLARLDVEKFALSPDGTRYVATVVSDGRRSAYVGSVERDAKDTVLGLGPPSPVHTDASGVRSVSWSSGTELSFLADSESGVQVYQASIDGSATTGGATGSASVLPDIDSRTLAVGTGANPDQYVTDVGGRLWYLPADGRWRLLDTPSFTGLAYGL